MSQLKATRNTKKASKNGADPAEITKFRALAADWWDPNGAMAPLHRMNPTRLEFLTDSLAAHFQEIKDLSILDVGCGGGLVAEPFARLGAHVTGIDAADDLIAIARQHALGQNLVIDYRLALTNDLITQKKKFDAVFALEVIEHVKDPNQFVRDLSQLVKPGGIVIISTLNRTRSSFALGIVAAEYVLRWLPRGTHDWHKFVKPSELHTLCTQHGLVPQQTMGLTYNPLQQNFALNPHNVRVNYFMVATPA